MGVPVNGEVATQRRRKGLQFCCCGCTLQVGCVIIGSLGMLNGVYVLLSRLAVLGGKIFASRQVDFVDDCIPLLGGIFQLVLGVCLIYGADKKRASLLKLWLYAHYFVVVLSIPVIIYNLVLLSSVIEVSLLFLIIFGFAVAYGIMIYFIAVVNSFYRNVSENVETLNANI